MFVLFGVIASIVCSVQCHRRWEAFELTAQTMKAYEVYGVSVEKTVALILLMMAIAPIWRRSESKYFDGSSHSLGPYVLKIVRNICRSVPAMLRC